VDENKLTINIEHISNSSTLGERDCTRKSSPEVDSTFSSVLHFEFIDGELKPKLNRKKRYSKLGDRSEISSIIDRKDLRLPEFSPAAITRLIEKRNHKFSQALNSHLELCSKQVLPLSPEGYRPDSRGWILGAT
jgi:DEAD/DEAH box helicase domain-containing protein